MVARCTIFEAANDDSKVSNYSYRNLRTQMINLRVTSLKSSIEI